MGFSALLVFECLYCFGVITTIGSRIRNQANAHYNFRFETIYHTRKFGVGNVALDVPLCRKPISRIISAYALSSSLLEFFVSTNIN